MKAVGYQIPGAIDREDALVDIQLEVPRATGRDILVEVKAVSVNPVDAKVRQSTSPELSGWKILGWDASGIVVSVGENVEDFSLGDEVYYAGALGRPGTNAEYHLVDERLVARKPSSFSFAEAAALPLTAITAWETLFERLDISKIKTDPDSALLIIGGAGGMGSIAIQIARAVTDVTVIASASRPETTEWLRLLGVHHVINHANPLAKEIRKLALKGPPTFVFSTTNTDLHISDIAELIAPQGRFALIDDPAILDVTRFKSKSVSTHWEFMFTRSMFETADMASQGNLLAEIARLADSGKIRSTLTETLGIINAENMKRAHALIESGKVKGKLVLEGFGS